MIDPQTARFFASYKSWANAITFGAVRDLPEGEALKERPTNFRNMVRTLNHIYVVDRIFQAHLEGRPHGYRARITDTTPPLEILWEDQQAVDRWYVDLSDRLSREELAEIVRFPYIDGGEGEMTRGQIIIHVVNHGTYHRGFVGDMLNQAGVVPRASDVTVFVRDAAPRAVASR